MRPKKTKGLPRDILTTKDLKKVGIIFHELIEKEDHILLKRKKLKNILKIK